MYFKKQSVHLRRYTLVIALVILQVIAGKAFGQLSITGTSVFSENFNGIGSSATASLPSGWRASSATYSLATTTTGAAAGTSGTGVITGSSGGNIYNFANGVTASSTDRALGILNSGSFTSGKCIHLQVTNNTGSTITGFTINFDYEKYRSGTREWTWTFQTSTDGTTYGSAISSGGQTFAADASNTVVPTSPTTTSKTVSITGLSLANGSSYYLRWTLTGTGGSTNGQALAVDNFSIQACVPPTAQTLTGGGGYCSGGSGVAIGLANSQSGVGYQLYNGATPIGSSVSGTGSALSLGTHTTTGTYSVVGTLFTGCTTNMTGTAVVSVNPAPAAQTLTGGGSYCVGGSGVAIGLSGSESSVLYQLYNGASTTGTAVSGTGSAISFGSQTATGTYTVVGTHSVTSCSANMTGSATVSTNPLPTPTISGTTTIASGGSATLIFTGVSGDIVYYWNGASTVTTTIGGAGTSTVTVSPTVTTTYSVTSATSSAGCSQSITGETATVTVTTAPTGNISGATAICSGATTTLTFSGTAGATLYYNNGTASVLSVTLSGSTGSGTATATVSPTVTTTYSLDSIVSGGFHGTLSGSVTVTVNSYPAAFSVTGGGSYCSGGSGVTIGLTNSASGVNYQLYNGASAVASSVAGTGSAISFGTFTASGTYTAVATLSGCSTDMTGSATVTIDALPTAFSVTGGGSYCTGGAGVTVGLGGSQSGVNYQLYNGSTAVGSAVSGTGSAISFGSQTTAATYTAVATNASTGCVSDMTGSAVVSISPLPSAGTITGTLTVPFGGTSALSISGGDGGGSWTSVNTSVATIGTTGTVTGIAAGTSLISYTVSNGCGTVAATATVTVNGPTAVVMACQSGLSYSEDFSSVSAWSDGFASGTGANRWWPVGVIGSASIPNATRTTVSSATFSTSSSAGVQKGSNNLIFLTTGTSDNTTSLAADFFMNFTGVNAGTLSFTAAEVNNNTGNRTGTLRVYYSTDGSAFTELTGSGLPYTATNNVSSSVSVSLSLPSDFNNNPNARLRFYYHNGSGGSTGSRPKLSLDDLVVTATSTVPAITGTLSMCVSGTTTLSNTTTGGSWSSGSSAIATVGTSGIVTGVASGTSVITYAVANSTGCPTYSTTTVTVNPVPSSTGATNNGPICVGGTVTLSSNSSDATAWSWSGPSGFTSSLQNPTATPTVTGTYSLTVSSTGSGCSPTTVYTTTVTVNPVPSVPSGSSSVCAGSSTTLTNSVSGTWASSNTGVATIWSATGVVSGVSAGTSMITFTATTGCFSTMTFTVNPTPTAVSISGTSAICVGSNTTLVPSVAGGTWSVSGGVATVDTAGVVSGITNGVAVISYTITNGFGCTTFATFTITINPLPAVSAISGTANVCIGSTTTLSSSTPSGVWSSSASAIGSISTAGVVTGISSGTTTITYTVTNIHGCSDYATKVVTINALPTISGPSTVCMGTTITLTGSEGGGTWTSSTPSLATVTSGSGIVSPVNVGTVTISYTTVSGCVQTKLIGINPAPSAISGPASVCVGSFVVLTTATTGTLVWSSSDTTVAQINASSGAASGVSTGTANITVVRASTGCFVTRTLSVNPTPSTITGSGSICVGSSNTYASSHSGGIWTSAASSVLAIDTTTGIGTGITGGITTISYRLLTGCRTTRVVTVNNLPSSISGNAPICVSGTLTLGSMPGGGTWSSGNPSVATIGTTGITTGVSAGTASVSYTNTVGCSRTAIVTVNNAPSAITGDSTLCIGSTTSLSSSPSGGTWTSSNTARATVGATSGVLTGISSGDFYITYTVTGSGCVVTRQMTVNSALAAITGPSSLCVGAVGTLTHPVGGGSWSSSDTTKLSVNTTGLITGISAGVAVITYDLGAGCFKTVSVSVIGLPPAIGGSGSVCPGSNTTLTNSVSGGAWSSSDAAVAVVNTLSGVVTGVSTGTSNISYVAPSGCVVTKEVTVNPLPSVIAGNSPVCAGYSIVLSSTLGGTWASSNVSVATVGSASGTVTGVTAGTAVVTYTLPTNCRRTATVSVGAMPAAITGSLVYCIGGTGTVVNATGGGTWSSSNPSVASIGSLSGVVNTSATGTASISYNHPGGCVATANVTVNNVPGSSAGDSVVCAGGSIVLTNPTTGGVWASSSSSLASVSTTGVVSGVAPGTVGISYSFALPGCYTIKTVTVNSTLAAISGPTNICIGSSATQTHGVSGGTWSSSTPSKATINSSTGVVTGISAGSSTITYTVSSGCYTTRVIYIQNLNLTVSGSLSVCTGSGSTLTCASTGGAWTSASPSVANINASTGLMTGVTPGTVQISYSLVGCSTVKVATVNALPDTISGVAKVCMGSTTALSNATTGGTWTSSATSVATVGSATGIVSGVLNGSTTISYTLSTGCRRTRVVTVGAMPAVITGTTSLCSGSATTLTCTTTGGTWSSGNTSVAIVSTTSSTSGLVSGTGTGTAVISYNHSGGCTRTTTVTVSAATASIIGDTVLCIGGFSTLSNATSGGTWTSSNVTKATVGSSSGVVTGIGAGSATVTYRTSATCYSTKLVTVNSAAPAIAGASSVCVGYTIALSNPISGGTWTSSDVTKAAVDPSSGLVTGLSAGVLSITYAIGTTCMTVKTVSVYNVPPSISGTASVCAGSFTVLSAVVGGSGVWSSSDTTIARVHISNGTVTGVSSGTAIVTYTAAATGCFSTRVVTVNAAPAPITGESSLCLGTLDTFTCATGGGVWNSGSMSIASIDSSSGILIALAGGGVTVSYTLANGCRSTKYLSVLALPASITGATTVCVGNVVTLTTTTSGGTWSSSDPAIATVSTGTGTSTSVSGVTTGSVVISYISSTGCHRTTTLSVNPAIGSPVGDSVVCVGQTITLTNPTTGGTWTSSLPSKATVGISTGIVTGVATGTSNLTYSLGVGCFNTRIVSVNATVPTITGPASICVSETGTLANTLSGGYWTSSNTSVATVDSGSGAISGVSAGSVTISYRISSGCFRTTGFVVKPVPAPITGPSEVLVAGSITLANTTSGGTWSSAAPSVASVSTVGVVTGSSAGSTIITYRVSATGCQSVKTVTVLSGAGKVETGLNNVVRLYPNPARSSFIIESSSEGLMYLVAMSGETIQTGSLRKGDNSIVLDDTLANGMYLCRLVLTDGTYHEIRVVVSR